MTFHKFKINFPKGPGPDFLLEIDGVPIKGVAGAIIKSAMISGKVYPVVELTILADSIEGEIEGCYELQFVRDLEKKIEFKKPKSPFDPKTDIFKPKTKFALKKEGEK